MCLNWMADDDLYPKDTRRVIKDPMVKLNRAGAILNERYKECDKSGHRDVNKDAGLCEYCYRRLDYAKEAGDALPEKSLDFPVMIEERRCEVSLQKSADKSRGLKCIMEEFNL